MAYTNDEMIPDGEWEVSCDPEVPGMVLLKLTELGEDGVKQHQIYLPPDLADDMSECLVEMAKHIRECH